MAGKTPHVLMELYLPRLFMEAFSGAFIRSGVNQDLKSNQSGKKICLITDIRNMLVKAREVRGWKCHGSILLLVLSVYTEDFELCVHTVLGRLKLPSYIPYCIQWDLLLG